MKKILVIGSLNMDIVTKVYKTPKVGETIAGHGMFTNAGGKGANQAVAMGKLGANVTMIGKVGNDSYGEELKANLKEMNVVDKVEKVDNIPTGTAFIMLNEDGDNSIVIIEGANGELLPEEVCEEWFANFDIVVLQNEIKAETVNKILETAKSLGKTTILNLAPARNIEKKYLECIDYLVVNETEFEVICKMKYEDHETLKKGYKEIGVQNLLITLGAKGAKFFDGDEIISVEAEKVDVVDTTAGGDSFLGGFVYSLSKGDSIEKSLKFANKVAGYTVGRLGAQKALPYLDEISN